MTEPRTGPHCTCPAEWRHADDCALFNVRAAYRQGAEAAAPSDTVLRDAAQAVIDAFDDDDLAAVRMGRIHALRHALVRQGTEAPQSDPDAEDSWSQSARLRKPG